VGVSREDYDRRYEVRAFALVPLHCSHQCSKDPPSGTVAQEKGMAGAEEARSQLLRLADRAICVAETIYVLHVLGQIEQQCLFHEFKRRASPHLVPREKERYANLVGGIHQSRQQWSAVLP
jgi:hypothetical protein